MSHRIGDAELIESKLNISYDKFIGLVLDEFFRSRKIPYEITQNGDYILPFGYNNDGQRCYLYHVYRPLWLGIRAFTSKTEGILAYLCTNAIAIYSGDVCDSLEEEQEKLRTEEWYKTIFNEYELYHINLKIWRYHHFNELTHGIYTAAIAGLGIDGDKIPDDEIGNYSNVRKFISKYGELISIINKLFRNGNLCLVLGAGISIPSKIPGWNELVKRLLHTMLQANTQSKKQISTELLDDLTSKISKSYENAPLMLMRFIRASISELSFFEKLYEIFYGTEMLTDTELLYAIASLCRHDFSEKSTMKIITYNFDCLLEKCLDNLNISYNSIYSDETLYKTNTGLDIYHVHGYLPADHDQIASSTIIFSEEDYHSIYGDPYNWSNVVQLNCFREYTCLFVGCSLSDPNIRRLLDAARNSKKMHYAIMLRKQLDINSNDTGSVDQCNDLLEELNEKYYESIGVDVIWVNEHTEVPLILRNIP